MSFCEIHNITTSLFFNWGSCHYHTHIAWVIGSPIKVIDIGWFYLAYDIRRRRTCTAFWDAYEYAFVSIFGFAAILCCSVTRLIICIITCVLGGRSYLATLATHSAHKIVGIWSRGAAKCRCVSTIAEGYRGGSPENYAIITCRECWKWSWWRGRRICWILSWWRGRWHCRQRRWRL